MKDPCVAVKTAIYGKARAAGLEVYDYVPPSSTAGGYFRWGFVQSNGVTLAETTHRVRCEIQYIHPSQGGATTARGTKTGSTQMSALLAAIWVDGYDLSANSFVAEGIPLANHALLTRPNIDYGEGRTATQHILTFDFYCNEA